ncbi:MAG TPA: FG-GAP-like repeat-containing protein, partial [bacterium]|nr:FG-GAP-like repeat-containing protein [bacterium]
MRFFTVNQARSSASRLRILSRISILLLVLLFLPALALSADPIAFDPAQSYTIGATPYRMAHGDFNKDGWEDIVVARDNTYYSILTNLGNGTFSAASYNWSGARFRDVTILYLAGDTVADLAFSNRGSGSSGYVRLLRGNGNGTFNSVGNISCGTYPEGIVSGDFNKDGLADVAVCRGDNAFGVLLGNAGGTLNAVVAYDAGGKCMELDAGLMDGDTDLDLVVANYTSNTVSVIPGDGAGGFGAARVISAGSSNNDVALGDVNGDGKLDAVLAEASGQHNMVVLLGDGLGGMTPFKGIVVGYKPFQVRLADLNGDGLLDISTANSIYSTGPGLSIALGQGHGQFTSAFAFFADQKGSGLAIADFDHSGLPDVATTDGIDTVRILLSSDVDADNDVLSDTDEVSYGTNPANPDSDGDGMPDGFEIDKGCLDPLVDDGSIDSDSDTLSNLWEYQNGLDPCLADSDGDGMPDTWELGHPCMGPGLSDGTDDYDSDVLNNYDEFGAGTNPCDPDSDSDGMDDYWELVWGFDPLVDDGGLDADGDGLTNAEEFQNGCSPLDPDSDADGLDDYDEVMVYFTDPYDQDSDDDGVTDGDEVNVYGSNPLSQDSDGGGEPDGSEVKWGRDPMNPADDAHSLTIGDPDEYESLLLEADIDNMREQVIYPAAEIGAAGNIYSLAVNVRTPPYVVINNFTIRMKHTPYLEYTDVAPGNIEWEGSGWEVNYQNDILVEQAGWFVFDFDQPFYYNGTDSLMVDFSFHDSTISEYSWGYVWCDDHYPSIRSIFQWAIGDSYGNPLDWSGPVPEPSINFCSPNIQLLFDSDQDGDGLYGYQETALGTDPDNPDTDGDGLGDGWEYEHAACGLNPLAGDSMSDPDGDGLTNTQELALDTDPCLVDTDDDGLHDGYEINVSLTDPLKPDSDGDGLGDGFERGVVAGPGPDNTLDSTPAAGDSVHDLAIWLGTDMLPGTTAAAGDVQVIPRFPPFPRLFLTDPNDPDSDGDGINDSPEVNWGANPLDDTIVPDLLIPLDSGNLIVSGAEEGYDGPMLACAGSEFGLAWLDFRDEPGCLHGDTEWTCEGELYFARIGQDGHKIGGDMRVTFDTYWDRWPSLIWADSVYGLAWSGSHVPQDIYFTRLSAQGQNIGPGANVSGSGAGGILGDITWSGSEFGLTWNLSPNFYNNNIFFARLSSQGQRIGPSVRITSGTSCRYSDSRLAWNGNGYGLIHRNCGGPPLVSDIYLETLAANGFLNKSFYPAASSDGFAGFGDLVWNGSEYMAAWYTSTGSSPDWDVNIYLSRISSPDHASSGVIDVNNASNTSLYPVLAWAGYYYGFSWMDDVADPGDPRDIYFNLLSPTGDKMAADLRLTDNPSNSIYPSICWNGSEFGLSWAEDYNNDVNGVWYDVYFARIGRDADGDGMTDTKETGSCTEPLNYDTDNDGIRDGLEDDDGDGLINQDDPGHCNPDTDADGLTDGDEVMTYGTDPLLPDTDGDGLTDGDEVLAYGTDPLLPDTDSDGLDDGAEILTHGTDPNNPDTDGDGLSDGDEVTTHFTDPLSWDSDGDYIPDNYEVEHMSGATPLDPLDPADGATNFETLVGRDNNFNFHEYWNQTDPWSFDPSPNLAAFPDTPGCYYWGEGDGDGYVLGSDQAVLQSQVLSLTQSYDKVLPRGIPDVQDLDADGYILGSDLVTIRGFILSMPVGTVNSRAADLEKVYEPLTDVLVGSTTHVTVRVRNSNLINVLYQGGFSVVFSI